MAPRIGFVHTAAFLVEDFRRRLAERVPDADAFHILDESLLQDLLRGAPAPEVHRRVANQLLAAVDAGAELVVMTCSSTAPGVDAARAMTSRPILKIDDPMAEQAARIGGRVALLCTASSTVGPSADLIGAHAERLGRRVEVRPRLVEGAYDALFAGDRDRHDELVLAAARDATAGADVVVLAQASPAPLQERIARAVSVPVLASPGLLDGRARRALRMRLGCIADDLTGATDLASHLTAAGLRTVLVIGVPTAARTPDADAVVVALKSRTIAAADAVQQSLAAAGWLPAEQLYFKYCSTFDSTAEGNIGPVIDALLDAPDAPLTVAVPALPDNARTVYMGHLLVGDRL